MVIQSNKGNAMDYYHAFIENRYAVELADEVLNIRYNTAALEKEGLYCAVIYLFCFICLYIAMKLYVMQRSKEMQICKAYGFSNIRIVGRMMEPLISVGFISLLIFAGMVVIINNRMGKFTEEYRLGFSWDILGPYVGVFVLAIVLTGIFPVYQLLHNSVVQSLNNRR